VPKVLEESDLIHRVTFRAFVASTEEAERVREALSLFISDESVSSTKAEGHYGNRIEILDATLNKNEGLAFFKKLREDLPKLEMDRLRKELSRRVDEECQLHFRLDKQAAYKGESHLTDFGDSIHVCARIESYPARREKAVKIAEALL